MGRSSEDDPASQATLRTLRSRIAVAVILPLGFFLVQRGIWGASPPFVWLPFYLVVFLCAWYGQRVSALISTVLSALLTRFVFLPDHYSWHITDPLAAFPVVNFLIMGLLFGELHQRMQGALARERDARKRLDMNLEAIIESTHDAIIGKDLQGIVTAWSKGAENLFGYTADEVIGKPSEFLYPSDRMTEETEILDRLATGEYIPPFTTERLHKDGSVIQISAAFSPIYNHKGELIGASKIARDISLQTKMEKEQRIAEERLKNLFESMQEGFFIGEMIYDENGTPIDWRFLDINNAYTKILGLSRNAAVGHTVKELFPHIEDDWLTMPARVAETGIQCSREGYTQATGRYYINHYYCPQRGQFACIFSDITERTLSEKALRDSEARYARVIQGSHQSFWELNLLTQELTVSPRLSQMLGYTDGEGIKFTLERWKSLVHRDDLLVSQEAAEKNIRGETASYEAEVRVLTRTGEWTWLLSQGSVVERDAGGQALIMSGTHTDISERKKAEALIWQQANIDSLTNLPNRRMLRDRLGQDIKRCKRSGASIAILFVDLDHFKEVNDTLGHDKGDLLLQLAAGRILQEVRETDTVSRQGGDEFAIILGDIDAFNRVDAIADNILKALEKPFNLDGDQAFVSGSIGITVYPADSSDIEELFKNADQALYVAKDAGRNRFSYFTPTLREAAQARLTLTNDLREAIGRDEFFVLYQPIMHLESGHMHKAEALVRWQHPGRGLVSPAQFIPIAESSGLIIDIGEWVFRQVAAQVKQWRDTVAPDFQVSVNKSPAQFANGDRQQQGWFAHMAELGLTGPSIVVEITEGLLLSSRPEVVNQLLELRDNGIAVSLDDFGTGYSSLSYLQKYDIDYLKIDQSFVRDLETSPKNLALCKAMIVMAHELGMTVVAEGVETLGQRDLLQAANCDYAQGFFFSRPVTAEALSALMLDQSLRRPSVLSVRRIPVAQRTVY